MKCLLACSMPTLATGALAVGTLAFTLAPQAQAEASSLPAFGGTEFRWNQSSEVWQKWNSTIGTWRPATSGPVRDNGKGPVLLFDNVGEASTTSTVDTSDGGGIKVTGKSTVTVASAGSCGGSLYVENGSMLTTHAGSWRNTEAAGSANFYIDGTLKLTTEGEFTCDAGGTGDQLWHIGAEGFVDMSGVSSVNKNGGQLVAELVTAGKPYEELFGRTIHNVEQSHTYITAGSSDAMSAFDRLNVFDSKGNSLTSAGDGDLTVNSYRRVADGNNLTIQYLVQTADALNLTWNNGNDVWASEATGWRSEADSVASYLDGDTVTFANDSTSSKTVTLGGDVAPTSMKVSGSYTFNGGHTIHVAEGLDIAASGGEVNFNCTVEAGTLRLANDDSGASKATTVTLAQDFSGGTLTIEGDNFTLNAPGYIIQADSFSVTGGGMTTIHALQVAGDGAEGHVIRLAAEAGSTTTFNSLVGDKNMGSMVGKEEGGVFLSIENCIHREDEGALYPTAGPAEAAYVFQQGFQSMYGSVNIHLDSKYSGLDASTLLTVNGGVSVGGAESKASLLSITGTARKEFNDTVNVQSITIGGSMVAADHGRTMEGVTTFRKVVSVSDTLTITGHAEAIFLDRINRGADVDKIAESKIIIEDGVLSYQRNTPDPNRPDYLGTIKLAGSDPAAARILTLGPLTTAYVNVEADGRDFTVGGAARKLYLSMTGGKSLSVAGGNVYLGDYRWYYYGTTGVSEASDVSLSYGLTGDISISSGGYLELMANADGAVFKEGASGNISVEQGILSLGGTTQKLYGTISLNDGSIQAGTGAPGAIGTFTATKDTDIRYSGLNNHFSANMAMGQNNLTITRSGEAGSASDLGFDSDRLLIEGDISGTGALHITGHGVVDVVNGLSFSGSVLVDGGAGLVLHSNKALYNASSLAIGSTYLEAGKPETMPGEKTGALSVTHGGSSVEMQGSITIGHGSRLNFTDILGHADTPAIALQGGLYFDGDFVISFLESDGRGLENLRTYNLVSSQQSVNFASMDDKPQPVVTVSVNGELIDSSKVAFGMSREGDTRTFYMTLLRGSHWAGADGGELSDLSKWNHDTTTDSQGNIHYNSYDIIFREQTGKDRVTISMTEDSSTTGIYMDGRTDYVFTNAKEGGQASFNAGNALLIKRGTADMVWDGIGGALGEVNVSEGALHLTNGASMNAEKVAVDDTVNAWDPVTQDELASPVRSYLAIDEGSTFTQGSATITGTGTGLPVDAEGSLDLTQIAGKAAILRGVDIENSTISGAAFGESIVANAALNGFRLEHVDLQGTGSLVNASLAEGVAMSENASYTLEGHVSIDSTVTNHGTVAVSAENTSINIGSGVSSVKAESTTTYTLFTGSGSYTNWDGNTLGADDVSLGGVKLSDLAKVTSVTFAAADGGSATVAVQTTEDSALTSWDANWGAESEAPVISKLFTSKSITGDYYVNTLEDGAYRYDKHFTANKAPEGADRIFVATLASGSGASNLTIMGVDSSAGANSVVGAENAPIDVWMSDEGSAWGRFIGGAGNTTANGGGTYYGNSHLQMKGDTTHGHAVVGGSLNVVQYGDTYLTIDKGTYNANVIGGALAAHGAEADKAVHHGNSTLHITGGTIGNAIGGSYQTYTDGDKTTKVQVDGGTVTNVFGGDFTTAASQHTGNVEVAIAGGTVTNVYGAGGTDSSGSTNLNKVEGDVAITLSGGTVTNIFGADSAVENTVTGNVNIDLAGGTVTKVYAAGAPDGQTAGVVGGNVTVRLHAGEDGQMLTSFNGKETDLTKNQTDAYGNEITISDGSGGTTVLTYMIKQYEATLSGGQSALNPGAVSTLEFVEAGTYNLEKVNVLGFSDFKLGNGAEVSMDSLNMDRSGHIRISLADGAAAGSLAEFTLMGGNQYEGLNERDLTIASGIKLNLRTQSYCGNWNSLGVENYPSLTVEKGATVDITDCPGSGSDLAVHLYLAGDGVDGKGALYKGDSSVHEEEGAKPMLGAITLTDNASIGGQSTANATIYGQTGGMTKYAAKLDLTNDGQGSYVLTKQGVNTLSLRNVDVQGGTLNVAEGEVQVAYSCSAGRTDVVLQANTTLTLAKDLNGYEPALNGTTTEDGTPSDFNGLSIGSLSGSGSIDLGNSGWLYIMRDGTKTDFDATYTAEGTFSKPADVTYAHFDGKISGSGRLSKLGEGTQYITGSESDYSGETHLEGGVLYLMAGSEVVEGGFSQGFTQVAKGAIGTASLVWKNDSDTGTSGALYLDDGVRIYNNGKAGDAVCMRIGVSVDEEADGNITKYHTATFSGVLQDAEQGDHAIFEKVGLGTLVLDQDNNFSGSGLVTEGTLKLKGWAGLGDGTIAPAAGSTLMLGYDGTYANEITEATTNFELRGTGDARWFSEADSHGHYHTASLISELGAGKEMQLKGNIVAGDEVGGLLHRGEGTLVLSGDNSYTGGTVVTLGKVVAASNTALGDTTAQGGSAVRTHASAQLEIASGAHVTLAAVAVEGEEYSGNDIRGTVAVDANAALVMESSGYYAPTTSIAQGGALVFRGKGASTDWSQADNAATGSVFGAGTLAVSDAAGEGTSAVFQLESGFTGDLVVEGDAGLLQVESGAIVGNVSVSGQGAQVQAGNIEVSVAAGKRVELRSTGSGDKAASFAAKSFEVNKYAVFSVSAKETEFRYSDVVQGTNIDVNDVVSAGSGSKVSRMQLQSATRAAGEVTPTIFGATPEGNMLADYKRGYDAAAALNSVAAGRVETQTNTVVFNSGSTYEALGGNASLANASLTLNVKPDEKINLIAEVSPADVAGFDLDKPYTTGTQLTLFTDVASFNVNFEDAAVANLSAAAGSENVYVTLASNVFTGGVINEATVLVYDAGAGVVYLDGVSSVPEPTTTTLGLLALAALCARRRRQRQDS